MSYNYSPEEKLSYYKSRMHNSKLTEGQRRFAKEYVISAEDGKMYVCSNCNRTAENLHTVFDNGRLIKVCSYCAKQNDRKQNYDNWRR